MTSGGHSPPPPTPGASRDLGKGATGGEPRCPYGVGWGGRGWAPRFPREAWKHQGWAARESARLGAGFPDPRALRIPLVSKFPPSSACQTRWWLRREARRQGRVGRHARPESSTRALRFPPTVRFSSGGGGGAAADQNLASSPCGGGGCDSPSTRSRDTTPRPAPTSPSTGYAVGAAGRGPRSLEGGRRCPVGIRGGG